MVSTTKFREHDETDDTLAFRAQAERVVEQLVALDMQYRDVINECPDRGIAFADTVMALAALFNVRHPATDDGEKSQRNAA